jgi:hypothetical protein
MVEHLQRAVTESTAKTDWVSLVQATLEKEIQSLRSDLTRVAERGSEQWRQEAGSWFEVQAEMLATKIEELSRASEARLARRLGPGSRGEDSTGATPEQVQAAAAKEARKASEQHLSRAEHKLEALFESGRAELDRKVFETLVQRLAEIERRAERYAESAVESVGDRLAVLGRETAARLAAEIDRRLAASEKALHEAVEQIVSERRRSLDSVAEAEDQARERLLGLAEELAAEIVAADRAQRQERDVHREAREVAAGLEELRRVSRRASRRGTAAL